MPSSENPQKFTIAQSSSAGRYMVATQDIAALDLILVDEAAVIGPKLQHQPVCLGCWEEVGLDTFIPCHLCGLPFCSDTCRLAASGHRAECEYVGRCAEKIGKKDLGEDSGVLAAVTVIRLLSLKHDQPDLYESIEKLEDNMKDMKLSEDWIIQEKVVKFLEERCGITEFSKNDINRALGILKSNGCNLAGFRARGLFPTFSLINHSCVRNARHIVNSKEGIVEVHAQRDIAAGEEINIRYTTDILETVSTRRKNIQAGWYFDCSCPRCKDKTECGSYTSALCCQICKEGYVLPAKPLQFGSVWKCENCGEEMTEEEAEFFCKKMKNSLDKIEASDVAGLEKVLTLAKNILHPNHCLLIGVKQTLFTAYGSAPGLQLQDLTPQHIQRKIRLADELIEVMEKIDPGLTALKGRILYEVDRFKLVMTMQKLQTRTISIKEFLIMLEQIVTDLEQAVPWIAGETVDVVASTLRERMMWLVSVKLLGEGYRMMLNTVMKLPFV